MPAAALAVGTGAVPWSDAQEQLAQLGPVVGFLAAVLVIARLCDDEGLFRAGGIWLARRSAGRPRRLLVGVFVLASAVTAVLSLDATVVLLTPVVLATTSRLRVRARPHVYACAHLSNTASLLLPVSNLTNLLALAAGGLGFLHFAGLMTLPWLAAIAVEYAVLRRFFAADLPEPTADATADTPAADTTAEDDEQLRPPAFVLAVLGATLGGFVLASALGVNPAWAALAGALVLAVRALRHRTTGPRQLLDAAALPFLAFVLSLGIVVKGVVDHGLATGLARLIPDGTSFPTLLAVAALAAIAANIVNNLPATLMLLPLTAPHGAGPVLAVLLGVNIGPNLTYAGSLATLLWRRVVHAHQHPVELREFTVLGLLTVPACLFAATVALWLSLQALGG